MIRISGATIGAAALLAVSACNPTPAANTNANAGSELTQSQAAAATVLGTMAGGANNPQMNAYVANLQKVADAFANVKDEASARAAGQQLAPVFAEMEKQSAELEKMGDAQLAAAAMAAAPQLSRIAVSMSSFAMTDPKLAEILGEELEKMPELKE
jgi:hypothetical protein